MLTRPYPFWSLVLVAVFSFSIATAIHFYFPVTASRLFTWQAPAHSIGDTTVTNDVTFRVVKVERTSGPKEFSAPAGQEFLVATIFLGNGTTGELQVSPLLQFHVKDSQGRVYTVTANPNQSAQLSGPLVAGDSLQQEISFLVPTTEQDFVLLYEPGVRDQAVVRISLSS